MSEEIYKFLELKDKLKFLKDTLSKYEVKLAELSTAKEILNRKNRSVYRLLGGLMLEVSREEAMDYIEKSENLFKTQIEKLREEISKLEREMGKVIKCS